MGPTATLLAELTQLRDQLGAAIRLAALGFLCLSGNGAGFVLSVNVLSLRTVGCIVLDETSPIPSLLPDPITVRERRSRPRLTTRRRSWPLPLRISRV